jgi:RHS repeat-associated protein
MSSGGSEYYVAHDAQGSVVALSSASGATEDTITYDPFGNVLTENAAKGAPAIPLKYDAEYLDPTGLYHVSARQLDPTIGAFISTDPRATTPSQPAISPYIFVADQPTVLIDPSGEYSQGGYGELNSAINAGYAEYNFYGSLRQAITDPFGESVSIGGDSIPEGVNQLTNSNVGSYGSGFYSIATTGGTLYQANNALNQYKAQTGYGTY